MNVLWIWLGFVTIIGACVGSFLNVVAYRLPLGKSIVSPPSACPQCGHRLAWYDNVPVLGWLWLRGRCRYCRTAISPQYPVVEAACAALFGVWFYTCYMTGLRPDFAGPGLAATAPIFAVTLLLIGGLLASTLIDARHFIIPLEIPWLIIAAAVIVLPLTVATQIDATASVAVPPSRMNHTTLFPRERLQQVRPIYRGSADVVFAAHQPADEPSRVLISAAPWADARGAAAAIGGAVGLVLSIVLLRLGVLRHSFVMEGESEDAEEEPLPENPSGLSQLAMLLGPVGLAIALALAADRSMWREPLGWLAASIVGGYAAVWVLAPLVRMVRRGVAAAEAVSEPEEPAFPPHPHPRREMLKEIAFLLPPIVGACLGGALQRLVDPAGQPGLHALGGVLLGLLIGGGVVWGVRILGTLGFGREAMGLGDVHLMAAVGAVTGWQVAVLAFVGAAFLGVGHAATSRGLAKMLKLRGGEIPYGPHLAAATFVVMIWREPLLAKLTAMFYLPI